MKINPCTSSCFSIVDLASNGILLISKNTAHKILPYKEGIILSLPGQHKLAVWNQFDGLMDFIGSGKEGDLDSRAIHCELYQPLGFCTEFDNVVYFVNYRSSCVNFALLIIVDAIFTHDDL